MTSPSRHRPRSSRVAGAGRQQTRKGCPAVSEGLGCSWNFRTSGPDRSSAGARREGAGLGDSPTRAIPLPRLQPRSAVSGDKDPRDPGAQGQCPRPRRARSARRRTALHTRRRLAAAARAPRPHSAPVQSLRDRQPRRSDRPRETSADSRVLFPHPRLAARRRLAEGRGGGRPRLAPPPVLLSSFCSAARNSRVVSQGLRAGWKRRRG